MLLVKENKFALTSNTFADNAAILEDKSSIKP